MAGPNLQISIGANVAGAVAGLNQTGAAANTAATGLNNAGAAATNAGKGLNALAPAIRPNLTGLTILGNAANKTAAGLGATAPAAAAAGRGLGSSANGANQAAQALTNVGRVAQDLPFGFIGVQNNLNPLLESFQRLRAATGSNATAFRALLGSLLGVGGLGFALSVVSSAIVIFQNGISGFNRKTKEAKDSADELTKALEATRTAANVEFGAIGGVQGQIFQVQALAQAVRDETRTQEERRNALDRLQGISKEYFGTVDLTKKGLEALTKASNDYVEAVTRQAIVEELKGEIGKIGAAYLKQRESVESLRGTIKQFISDKGLETKLDSNGRAIFDFTGKNAKAQSELRKMNLQLAEQEKALQPLSQRFGELRNALTDATFSMLGFKKTTGNGDAEKKEVDLLKQRIDRLKELKDTIGLTTAQQREFVQLQIQLLQRDGVKLGFTPQEVKDQIDELLRTRFGREVQSSPITVPLIIQPKPVIDVAGAVLPGGIIPPNAFDDVINALKVKSAVKLDKIRENLSEKIQQVIKDGVVEGIFNVGDAIGVALSGALDIGDAFQLAAQSLLQTIGGVLQQVGKELIAVGTIVQVLKRAIESLFANPVLAVAVGIGLVALGSALKNIKFNVPGFATGVTSFAGGLAVVGENGPELVRLPGGSDVIPNSRIGDFTGNVFIATSVLRGEDIYTSYNRARGRRGRI